jgi:hypothetical protein
MPGCRWRLSLFSASLAVDSHGGLTKVARDRAQPVVLEPQPHFRYDESGVPCRPRWKSSRAAAMTALHWSTSWLTLKLSSRSSISLSAWCRSHGVAQAFSRE